MKLLAFTVLLTLLTACTTSQHTSIASFWAAFQQAVFHNDQEAVADMTVFPLLGAEGYVESFDSMGISRAQFLQQFDRIFDEKVKATIAKTTAADLERYLSPKDAALQSIALPPNTTVYYLTVLSVFDEGLETQSESAVIFYFLKEKTIFKLAYLSIAG